MTPSTPSDQSPEALSETVTVRSGEQAYTIKPLEWRKCEVSGFEETWDAGGYSVIRNDGKWYWMPPDGFCDTPFGAREEAQAEAEKSRLASLRAELIPAALSPSSSPPAAAGEGDVLERAAKLAGIPEPLTESLLHLAMMVDQFGPCFFGRRDIDAVRLLAARVVELTAENEKLKEMPLKYYPPASTSPADRKGDEHDR